MPCKVVDFQGLLLDTFFVTVFGARLIDVCSQSIFGPKMWTPRGAYDSNYLCPLLWRPIALALERFHECLLDSASAKNAEKMKSRIQEE